MIGSLYAIFLIIILLCSNNYPLDPNSYPLRLNNHFLVQHLGLTFYIPESNLLNDTEGLLSTSKSKDITFQLIQYNSQGNIIGHHHRVNNFDINTAITLDFDNDGIDELLVFKYDKAIKGKTEIYLYKRDGTLEPLDTLAISEDEFVGDRRMRLDADTRKIAVIGDSKTIYLSYSGGLDFYKYRYFNIYSRGNHPHLAKRIRIPFAAHSISVIHFGPDSSHAVISDDSHCNGVYGFQMNSDIFPDSMSDCQSVVMRITNEGEVLWVKALADGGGTTKVTSSASGDTILAMFYHQNFISEQGTIHLYRLNGSNGDILDHRELSGYFDYWSSKTSSERDFGLLFIRQDRSSSALVRLSRTGSILDEYNIPVSLGLVSSTSWMTLPNGHLAVAFLADGPSIAALDVVTRTIAFRQPIETIHTLRVVRMEDDTGHEQDQLLAESRIDATLMSVESNPLPGWLIRRYRWLLLAFLIPPASAYYGLRYLRLRKESRHSLELYAEQLRQLSASLRNAQEEERKRVSRDIHDRLGQLLTSLRWSVESLPLAGKKEKGGIIQQVDELQDEVRRISNDLRPPLLDEMGLLSAIEWELDRFRMRFGVHTELIGESTEEPENPQLRLELFRVVQEGLTNVVKHSQASSVQIEYMINDSGIQVSIIDDGRGALSKPTSDSGRIPLGLLGMRERLSKYAGQIDFEQGYHSGSTLRIQVPLVKTIRH